MAETDDLLASVFAAPINLPSVKMDEEGNDDKAQSKIEETSKHSSNAHLSGLQETSTRQESNAQQEETVTTTKNTEYTGEYTNEHTEEHTEKHSEEHSEHHTNESVEHVFTSSTTDEVKVDKAEKLFEEEPKVYVENDFEPSLHLSVSESESAENASEHKSSAPKLTDMDTAGIDNVDEEEESRIAPPKSVVHDKVIEEMSEKLNIEPVKRSAMDDDEKIPESDQGSNYMMQPETVVAAARITEPPTKPKRETEPEQRFVSSYRTVENAELTESAKITVSETEETHIENRIEQPKSVAKNDEINDKGDTIESEIIHSPGVHNLKSIFEGGDPTKVMPNEYNRHPSAYSQRKSETVHSTAVAEKVNASVTETDERKSERPQQVQSQKTWIEVSEKAEGKKFEVNANEKAEQHVESNQQPQKAPRFSRGELKSQFIPDGLSASEDRNNKCSADQWSLHEGRDSVTIETASATQMSSHQTVIKTQPSTNIVSQTSEQGSRMEVTNKSNVLSYGAKLSEAKQQTNDLQRPAKLVTDVLHTASTYDNTYNVQRSTPSSSAMRTTSPAPSMSSFYKRFGSPNYVSPARLADELGNTQAEHSSSEMKQSSRIQSSTVHMDKESISRLGTKNHFDESSTEIRRTVMNTSTRRPAPAPMRDEGLPYEAIGTESVLQRMQTFEELSKPKKPPPIRRAKTAEQEFKEIHELINRHDRPPEVPKAQTVKRSKSKNVEDEEIQIDMLPVSERMKFFQAH